MKAFILKIFFLVLTAQTSYSQLSNFVLTVTKTDESCTGNGTLSFNVDNTTSGSTIIYRIYRLPDVINTIAVLSTNTFGGLSSGIYRVIATQTLGSSSGIQQQDITIEDTRSYITYQVSSTAENCETGTININVLTGNALSYEIVSGPVIVEPQSSNVFTNLPSGTYNIRVNDACGEGVVQTFTLLFSIPPNLVIGTPITDCPLVACDSISVSYFVTASGTTTIRYPLTAQLIIFPPAGGTPIVQNQTLTSGDPSIISLSNVIPLYYAQLYTFNIRIVDACGNVYIKNNNQINLRLSVGAELKYTNCIKRIQIDLCNFLPPYTVNFVSTPSGFNAVTYNSEHPGPFTSGSINYTSTNTSEIPNGAYTIQVTDACNNTATCQVNVIDKEPLYSILDNIISCVSNKSIQIPQNIIDGPFISTAIITSSTSDLGFTIPHDITPSIFSPGILIYPLPEGTYTIEGLDVCGHNYSYTFTILPIIYSLITTPRNITGCSANGLGGIAVNTLGAQLSSIIITQAPTTLIQTLPYNVSFLIPAIGSSMVVIPNLPAGDYTLEVTDSCGNIYIRNVTIITTISSTPLLFYDKRGCGENFDSMTLASPNGALQTVIITAAPASFSFPLPYDVSFNIATNGTFYMNSFQEGNYTFYTKDICNQVQTPTYFLTGYRQVSETTQVIPNCGSFDLNMNFTDNTIPAQLPSFWLQKFNPITNQWIHPITEIVYSAGSVPNSLNSYSLNNLTINYNIAATGTFRILTKFNYFTNGLAIVIDCVETIKTFEYNGDIKIIAANGIPCVNGGSQVFIIANGTPPLDYKITTKDGLPFLVENGTSNSFSGLLPGIYNFRVQDACGNIVNRLFDIITLQEPEIMASNLCDTFDGQLSVQPFSFLNYEWWKGDNTSNILSTTNVLSFNPFIIADAGVYHVRIYSTTLNSCVDRILTYTIPTSSTPNAGLDGTRVICGNSPSIDLFTILNGSYNTGGTWQEITTSGMLVGNNWLPDGLPFGTYIFKYIVNGFCDTTDDSLVTITLNAEVEVPIIDVNESYCAGENIEFVVQSIPNAIYQWSGPNDFLSSLQNPIITNATAVNDGIYTVKAILGECESESSVLINSNPIPDYIYQKSCVDGVFKVEIIPVNDSFDTNTATYSWTGPNNFISTSNPIIITNQAIGNYSVIVTSSEGCLAPQIINVTSTFCDFPNVITPNDDGSNDSLDLTNYEVILLQIYSRWGRLVYEKDDYINEWYGQNMNGGYLPDSTYYYFVKLKNGEEKYGWVFIGRG